MFADTWLCFAFRAVLCWSQPLGDCHLPTAGKLVMHYPWWREKLWQSSPGYYGSVLVIFCHARSSPFIAGVTIFHLSISLSLVCQVESLEASSFHHGI
jgi:hypothetical protein